MNLALFDFDGTLTTKDSLDLFLKYSVSKQKYLINMVQFSPYFIAYKTKLLSNNKAKEKLFEIFFKGIDEQVFKETSKNFALTQLDKIINKDMYETVQQHIKNGDRVIIVSASIECYLKHWSQKESIELLSTKLNFKSDKFTGKFLTKNCYGDEKVNRIKEHLQVDEYDTIYAYGDSPGDTQMLKLADIPKWVKH